MLIFSFIKKKTNKQTHTGQQQIKIIFGSNNVCIQSDTDFLNHIFDHHYPNGIFIIFIRCS